MITQADVEQLVQLLQKINPSSLNGIQDQFEESFRYLLNNISRPESSEEDVFDGELDLSNTSGTLYADHAQLVGLTLSVGEGAIPGGWAMVKIIASTDSISVPAGWVLYGGDAIDTTLGAENNLQIFYKDEDNIYYTNKVV